MNNSGFLGNNAGQNDLVARLEEQNIISPDQGEQIRRRARRTQCPLQQAVLDMGFASQTQVYEQLSIVTGIPFVVISKLDIADEVIRKVSAKVALHYQFVPLKMERGTLQAAFANPPAVRDRENLRLLLGMRLDPVLSTPGEVSNALKRLYGLGAEKVIQIRQERKNQNIENYEGAFDDKTEENLDIQDGESDASIINLVNEIILEAMKNHATDIHIEPYRDQVKVRYRIDGMLREIPTPAGMVELHDAIVSRIKIMAKLNIAERRLPHDGRIRMILNHEASDLRVSIMPTRFGETICLRILNSSSIFISMAKLGLSPYQQALLGKLVSMSHGIILVTGPTGSGKTTTLYAALAYIRDHNRERKIITIENPVEYELEGTSQIQMHAEIGLTFAAALRSILRHDPDIILVGEIRDNETADIAIQSALTGHLVLSTLHTNDSVGAVNRLINMGVEPYLVASALVAAVAQRLVRRICPHCKELDENIPRRMRAEMAEVTGIAPEDIQAWKGRGCLECNNTGYRGRVAIYEFFLLDDEIQDMVAASAGTSALRKAAIERGMRVLRQDGLEKVAHGETTIEEVQRITSNFQISYDLDEFE